MAEIELTQGKIAIVDEEDFERLSKYKWCTRKGGNTFYAIRWGPRVDGKRRVILMHREILGLKPGDPDVDHRDGNGLNNQKKNLRIATKSQNAMNQQKTRGTSRFKGVYWHKPSKKWRARICVNGEQKQLGHFMDEEEAARAYDEKAREIFGEFAKTNFGGEVDGL